MWGELPHVIETWGRVIWALVFPAYGQLFPIPELPPGANLIKTLQKLEGK